MEVKLSGKAVSAGAEGGSGGGGAGGGLLQQETAGFALWWINQPIIH